jgi:hypothetical protein
MKVTREHAACLYCGNMLVIDDNFLEKRSDSWNYKLELQNQILELAVRIWNSNHTNTPLKDETDR